MTLKERIEVLEKLGKRLAGGDEYLDAVIHRTSYNNPWFTKENQHRRIKTIAEQFLQKEKLEAWISDYKISDQPTGKTVALIPSDNLPLADFRDVLSAFIAGHKSIIKLAEKDQYLLPCLFKFLKEIDERTENFLEISNRFEKFDAVITNIGNKSGQSLETYFGKFPNILRKTRSSVAVLSGEESDADLLKLGDDIFSFFGLSPRNVSKIYFPKGYEIKHFLEVTHEFKELVLNNKYKNNFDYNFAALTLDKTAFHINGCMILVEKPAIRSRTSVAHFEFYEDKSAVEKELSEKADEVQNIVAEDGFLNLKTIPFGKASSPELSDYLAHADTLELVTSI